MKKIFIFLCVAMAFTACNKAEVVSEPEQSTANQIKFDFSVNQQDETKSKTGWESGDKVFVFFKTIETKYVQLTYDGTEWTSTAPSEFDHTDFDGIAGEDKVLTAIHFPAFVGTVNVTWDGESNLFKFTDTAGKKIGTYYMFSNPTAYTVDGDTVTAYIPMQNPAQFVQFFLPISDAGELGLGHGYRLYIRRPKDRGSYDVLTKSCTSIDTNGSITVSDGYSSMKGYRCTNAGQNGIMFSGYVRDEVYGWGRTMLFSLVYYQSEAKPYAIGQRTYTNTKQLEQWKIYNLPDLLPDGAAGGKWTSMDQFVDMGFLDVKWSVGYLIGSTETGHEVAGSIAGPEERGYYYAWGDTKGYSKDSGHAFTIANAPYYDGSSFTKYTPARHATEGGQLDNGDDAAYQLMNGATSGIHMPTGDQMARLFSCLSKTMVDGKYPDSVFTTDGYAFNGRLVTSNQNGITILLPCCGYSENVINFWSATIDYESVNCPNWARRFYAYHAAQTPWGAARENGLSIRPVKNF